MYIKHKKRFSPLSFCPQQRMTKSFRSKVKRQYWIYFQCLFMPKTSKPLRNVVLLRCGLLSLEYEVKKRIKLNETEKKHTKKNRSPHMKEKYFLPQKLSRLCIRSYPVGIIDIRGIKGHVFPYLLHQILFFENSAQKKKNSELNNVGLISMEILHPQRWSFEP